MGKIKDSLEGLLGSGGKGAPGDVAAPSMGGVEGASHLEALKKDIRGSRSRQSRVEDELKAREEMAAVEKLYEAENWEEIASLYFNARYAMTGYEGFLLSDKQKAILSTSMATVMRLLIQVDPRWVALTIFSVNFTALVAEKEVSYKAVVAKMDGKGKG